MVSLGIDDEQWTLDLAGGSVRQLERGTRSDCDVALTAPVFTQLVWGYRPATWAVEQADQRVPAALVPWLATLFPPDHQASIIGMDGC